MPLVVVVGGVIQCSHKGTITLSSGDNRLEISGAAALTAGMEAGLSFAPGAPGVLVPCPFPAPLGPPGSSPCAATIKAIAGVSTQLTVGGQGVLLDNASGLATNPNDPSATWNIAQAGQMLMNIAK